MTDTQNVNNLYAQAARFWDALQPRPLPGVTEGDRKEAWYGELARVERELEAFEAWMGKLTPDEVAAVRRHLWG